PAAAQTPKARRGFLPQARLSPRCGGHTASSSRQAPAPPLAPMQHGAPIDGTPALAHQARNSFAARAYALRVCALRMLAAKNSRKRIEARAPAAATGRAGELIGMSWFMMDGSRQAARDNPLRPMHSTGDIHCGL